MAGPPQQPPKRPVPPPPLGRRPPGKAPNFYVSMHIPGEWRFLHWDQRVRAPVPHAPDSHGMTTSSWEVLAQATARAFPEQLREALVPQPDGGRALQLHERMWDGKLVPTDKPLRVESEDPTAVVAALTRWLDASTWLGHHAKSPASEILNVLTGKPWKCREISYPERTPESLFNVLRLELNRGGRAITVGSHPGDYESLGLVEGRGYAILAAPVIKERVRYVELHDAVDGKSASLPLDKVCLLCRSFQIISRKVTPGAAAAPPPGAPAPRPPGAPPPPAAAPVKR